MPGFLKISTNRKAHYFFVLNIVTFSAAWSNLFVTCLCPSASTIKGRVAWLGNGAPQKPQLLPKALLEQGTTAGQQGGGDESPRS